jgi:hypothetical protein
MLDSDDAWICDNSTYSFMTMNLGKYMLVTGVVIQARKLADQYVKEIEVQYSTLSSPSISCSSQCHVINSQWISLKSASGNLRFFPTSTFQNQEKSILLFQESVVTQYIKITIHAVYNGITMRTGVTVATLRLFVRQECNTSRDVICERCQTCVSGFFVNNTCGQSYGNDRLDTQCAVCPADFYYPDCFVSQSTLPCPENGRSSVVEDEDVNVRERERASVLRSHTQIVRAVHRRRLAAPTSACAREAQTVPSRA